MQRGEVLQWDFTRKSPIKSNGAHHSAELSTCKGLHISDRLLLFEMGSSIELYALVLATMPSYEKAGLLADDVVRLRRLSRTTPIAINGL